MVKREVKVTQSCEYCSEPFAIFSVIFGILSIIFSLFVLLGTVLGIIGLFFGLKAKNKKDELKIWGIALSGLGILIGIAMMIWAIPKIV